MKLKILQKINDVVPFIDVVQQSGDSDRVALGFLPRSAYETACWQGKLFVAVALSENERKYAGHLFFGGVYPFARIVQLFVSENYRKEGVASSLLNALRKKLVSQNWLSLSAKVAADLPANAFWESSGFRTVRTKPGGQSRDRMINVRVLDLDTPSLLNFLRPRSAFSDFQIIDRRSFRSPVYMFDLNVLFDIIRQRPQQYSAGRIINAAMENRIRLNVAEEFLVELLRNSGDLRKDPVMSLVSHFPRLSSPPEQTCKDLIQKLGKIIFPEKLQLMRLTVQDQSDLRHLATAVFHKVDGFVTSEKAILVASGRIKEEFDLDIASIADINDQISDGDTSALQITANTPVAELSARPIKNTTKENTPPFFIERGVASKFYDEIVGGYFYDCDGLGVYVGATVVAQAYWRFRVGPGRILDAFVCADELEKGFELALDYILTHLTKAFSKQAPCVIRLATIPGHAETRALVLSHGFIQALEQNVGNFTLERIAVHDVITPDKWGAISKHLSTLSRIRLPKKPPVFEHPDQKVEFANNEGGKIFALLSELERYFSPAIFLLPKRTAIVIPIRRAFSEDMFRADPQTTFLIPPQAIMRGERAYIGSGRLHSIVQVGVPILFYESSRSGNGRGAIIAIARVTKVGLIDAGQSTTSIEQRGVLDEYSLQMLAVGKRSTEILFDNILVFKSPVSMQKLRNIGCVDGANFVSAKKVNHDHLLEIVRLGGGYA